MYFVFGFDQYYPLGGANDLVGSYGTLEEAQKCMEFNLDLGSYDYMQVTDSNLQIIEGNG
tara:strand:- start:1019 stop:1198 length:180 start_codon:yes stop_codon:yes gene_type:complete